MHLLLVCLSNTKIVHSRCASLHIAPFSPRDELHPAYPFKMNSEGQNDGSVF